MRPRTPLQAFTHNLPPDNWTPAIGRQRDLQRRRRMTPERPRRPKQPTWPQTYENILAAVSAVTCIPAHEIEGPGRHKLRAQARWLITHFCMTYTTMRLQDVANRLKRHHSTLLHGLEAMEENPEDYRLKIRRVEALL